MYLSCANAQVFRDIIDSPEWGGGSRWSPFSDARYNGRLYSTLHCPFKALSDCFDKVFEVNRKLVVATTRWTSFEMPV
jgi:hypothetical protein